VFDRDKEPFVQVSAARYAHKACAEKNQVEKTQKEKDYDALVNYIENLFGIGYVSAKVAKQIKEYRETYNYTYSGMLGTLVYWYEVKGATIDQANGGIGIIPYVYDQALQYYYALYLAQIANEDKDIEHYEVRVKEFFIEEPQRIVKPPHLFKFREED
jgi:hypothetical protein